MGTSRHVALAGGWAGRRLRQRRRCPRGCLLLAQRSSQSRCCPPLADHPPHHDHADQALQEATTLLLRRLAACRPAGSGGRGICWRHARV